MSDNYVTIFVFVKNADHQWVPADLTSTGWTIEPGPVATIGKGSDDYYGTSISGTTDPEANEVLVLYLDDTEKPHGNEAVADKYRNEAYHITVDPSDGGLNVNDTADKRHSGTLTATGDLTIPKTMTFYFPLKMTTPAGLEISLLLGQHHDKKGFFHILHDLADAAKAVVKGAADVEDENDLGVARHAVKFQLAVDDLFKSDNPWNVAIIGSQDYPVFAIPEVTIDKEVATYPHLLWVGPTSSGKKQAICIDYEHDDKDQNQDHTFVLKIYNEWPA